MLEIWKDIKGYKGLYQVSNLGNVKSLERNVPFTNRWGQRINRLHKEHLLKQSVNKYGYLCVILHKEDIPKHYAVHRLVYEAFYGKIPFWMQVNHINERKDENNIYNLNVLTPKDNNNWGTRIERISKTNTNGKLSKPVIQYDLDGNFIKEWPSASEIKRQLGYHDAAINRCCNNKVSKDKNGYYYTTKSAYGYIWKYKDVS